MLSEFRGENRFKHYEFWNYFLKQDAKTRYSLDCACVCSLNKLWEKVDQFLSWSGEGAMAAGGKSFVRCGSYDQGWGLKQEVDLKMYGAFEFSAISKEWF